jgi:phosphatidate cytidylyltransferase
VAKGDLGRRVAVAGVGIPLGVAILFVGGWVLTGTLIVLAVIGTLEVYGLALERGWRPFRVLGVIVAVLLMVLATHLGSFQSWAPWALGLLMVLGLGGLAGAVFRRGPGGDPLLAVGTTLLGVAYAALPLAFAVFLRDLPGMDQDGPGWAGAYLVMFPLVVTWLGDTCAYFTGKHLGKRKLLPSVSPKKTVAGGVGGLVGATMGAVAFAALFLGGSAPATLPLLGAALLGLIIGAVAQVGDLAESVLKREAGVKDSGNILPGHGGVLDRFDAIYFTLPLTYAALPFLLQ